MKIGNVEVMKSDIGSAVLVNRLTGAATPPIGCWAASGDNKYIIAQLPLGSHNIVILDNNLKILSGCDVSNKLITDYEYNHILELSEVVVSKEGIRFYVNYWSDGMADDTSGVYLYCDFRTGNWKELKSYEVDDGADYSWWRTK